MNTTVVLKEPADFGEGLVTFVRFVDAKYHVDDEHQLHIKPDVPGGRDPSGNVATFQPDEWRSVVRGVITREDNEAVVDREEQS